MPRTQYVTQGVPYGLFFPPQILPCVHFGFLVHSFVLLYFCNMTHENVKGNTSSRMRKDAEFVSSTLAVWLLCLPRCALTHLLPCLPGSSAACQGGGLASASLRA